MPVNRASNLPKDNLNPQVARKLFINKELGGESLTVGEATIAPGGSIPLHIHPGHEEGILITEGTLEGRLGNEKSTLKAGDVIVAPKGIKHDLVNKSQKPAKIVFIYPTLNVTREWVKE